MLGMLRRAFMKAIGISVASTSVRQVLVPSPARAQAPRSGTQPMFRNVEFQSEGATLRGRLYANTNSPSSVVVMAHGISATITMVADRYAEALHDAGATVLLYDHRNFGLSDGEPRQEFNPWVQARGFRDAVTYVSSLPEIDKSRIVLWGDSVSAGQTLVVGAVDARVKAIIAQVPACGPTPPPADPDGALFAALKRTFEEGNIKGSPETTAAPIPVVSLDQTATPSLLKPASAYRWFTEYGGHPGTAWENKIIRVTPKTPAPFHPGLCAPHINVPVLALISPEDEIAGANPAVARAAYDSIPAKKKELVEIAGGHFGLLYHPSDLFNKACRAQRDFLARAFV